MQKETIGKKIKAHWGRILWSLLLILLVMLSFSTLVDEQGSEYTDAGFKRALATFAIAKGLNGVISVAQETELVLQPVGVGVTLAPGQILDPVNDMVERFSWVMLASTTSLGVQGVLLEMVRWPPFSWLIAVLGVVWLVTVWRRDKEASLRTLWISRLMVLVLLLRFSIPLISVAGEGVYEVFLEDRYTESISTLQATMLEVEELNTMLSKDASLTDRAKHWVTKTKNKWAIKERMERYEAAVSNASESAINLIVVFVIQTILLPLFFIWLLFKAIRSLLVGLVATP